MRHLFVGLTVLLGSLAGSRHAQAQGTYVDDALLYTRQNPSGSARTLGLAGATTALGGDFGSLTTNPAGLGLYTKSEFTATIGLGFGTATSTPVANLASSAQTGVEQNANSFHIPNLGLVFTGRRADNDEGSDWRGGSFALGFTRLADFNQGFRYRNTVDDAHSFYQRLREPGHYVDYTGSGYQGAATDIINNGYKSDYYIDGLAYDDYLTNYQKVVNGGTTYYQITTAHPRTGNVQQDEVVKSQGSLSQFDLGYGGNYRNRLYIGIGAGLVSMNRTRTSSFAESQNGLENFRYDDYVKTTGTGVNGRLGIIVRVVDALRLGAAIQTPTYISLNDQYSTTLTVNPSYVQNNNSNVVSTPDGTYDYNVTLPFRANGGLTVLFGKYGFLTADAEYVGYSQTRFNPNSNDNVSSFADVNADIKAGYRNTLNLKAGIEGRFDVFRVRAGYARYGNPYANGTLDRGQNYITGGLGYRSSSFFLDAAVVYMSTSDQYSPYTLYTGEVGNSKVQRASPLVNITPTRTTTSITAGFLF